MLALSLRHLLAGLLLVPSCAYCALPLDALKARNDAAVHFSMRVDAAVLVPKPAPGANGDATCRLSGIVLEVYSKGPVVPGFQSPAQARVDSARDRLTPGARIEVAGDSATRPMLVAPSGWAMPCPLTPGSRMELWGQFEVTGAGARFRPFDAR